MFASRKVPRSSTAPKWVLLKITSPSFRSWPCLQENLTPAATSNYWKHSNWSKSITSAGCEGTYGWPTSPRTTKVWPWWAATDAIKSSINSAPRPPWPMSSRCCPIKMIKTSPFSAWGRPKMKWSPSPRAFSTANAKSGPCTPATRGPQNPSPSSPWNCESRHPRPAVVGRPCRQWPRLDHLRCVLLHLVQNKLAKYHPIVSSGHSQMAPSVAGFHSLARFTTLSDGMPALNWPCKYLRFTFRCF